MANIEHLKMLRTDLNSWNKFRENNPNVKLQFYRANLAGFNLRKKNLAESNFAEADLSSAYLCDADFSRAYLRETDLSDADLTGSNLSKADLCKAVLCGTILIRAKITEANLTEANLFGSNMERAILHKANLEGADFRRSNLCESDLSKANLKGANLERAILSRADLSGADLSEANLCCTDFKEANLNGANLSDADLFEADLREARLLKTILYNANLTGVALFGTARENWRIRGVKCDYAFWDEECKIRDPDDGKFETGEFEKLYEILPKIEYIFLKGLTPIDLLVIDLIVEEINDQNPEFELKMHSWHSRGKPRAHFNIRRKEYIDAAYKLLKEKYEERISILKGKKEELRMIISEFISKQRNVQLITGPVAMSQDSYKIEGQTAAVGPGAHAHDINFDQVWKQVSSEIDTSQLYQQLTQLRLAMKKEAEKLEHDTAIGEIATAESAAKEGDGPNALKHLKKAGRWALSVAETVDTPIVAETLKKFIGL